MAYVRSCVREKHHPAFCFLIVFGFVLLVCRPGGKLRPPGRQSGWLDLCQAEMMCSAIGSAGLLAGGVPSGGNAGGKKNNKCGGGVYFRSPASLLLVIDFRFGHDMTARVK